MAKESYSGSPFLMKGAFIELQENGLIGVLPSFNFFQYNPQSLSRSVRPAQKEEADETAGSATEAAAGGGDDDGTTNSSQPYDPLETVRLSLVIDATDDLAEGNKLAVVTGIADRIASIELLMYPEEESFLGKALEAVGDVLGATIGARSPEERPSVPIVLFWFGPGKIVPVRITSLSIEEQAFHSVTLYPTRATLSVGLRILREHELADYPDTLPRDIANFCYVFTTKQKRVLSAIGGPIRATDALLGAIDSDLAGIL